MKKLLFVLLILPMASCSFDSGYDYKLSSLKHRELPYKELPDSVKALLYSSAIGNIERDELLFVNSSDSSVFHFKVVESIFVNSWIAYYKLIDADKNIVYRIERGTPSPYVIDGNTNKLYITNDYVFLSRINILYDSIKKQGVMDSIVIVESIMNPTHEGICQTKFTEYELK